VSFFQFQIRDRDGYLIREILMRGITRRAALQQVERNCIHKGNGEHVTYRTQWHEEVK